MEVGATTFTRTGSIKVVLYYWKRAVQKDSIICQRNNGIAREDDADSDETLEVKRARVKKKCGKTQTVTIARNDYSVRTAAINLTWSKRSQRINESNGARTRSRLGGLVDRCRLTPGQDHSEDYGSIAIGYWSFLKNKSRV